MNFAPFVSPRRRIERRFFRLASSPGRPPLFARRRRLGGLVAPLAAAAVAWRLWIVSRVVHGIYSAGYSVREVPASFPLEWSRLGEDPGLKDGEPPAKLLRHTIGAARTQLDDLQSELEASSRQVDKIRLGTSTLKELVSDHLDHSRELMEFLESLSELGSSVRQQRALISQLRATFDELRRHAATRG